MNQAYLLRWYYKDSVELTATKIDGIKLNGRQANDLTPVPAEVIDLTAYNRLHLICASADYGMEFKLEQLSGLFNILEVDGYPISPVLTERLFLQPGETAVVEVVSSTSHVDLIATAGGHHKNETYIGSDTFHAQGTRFGNMVFVKNTKNAKTNEKATAMAKLIVKPNTATKMDQIVPIVNEPYILPQHYPIVTDRALLKGYYGHYYPSPDDKVFKLHLNTNFANTPSFNGKTFVRPRSLEFGNVILMICAELQKLNSY